MAKKIEGYIKLNIPAGGANPSPPVGPALGQRGVNIMEFCKAFNAATDSLEKNMPIPVVITVYQDKSFTFTTKTAPVSFFLKKAAGLNKGGQEPGRAVAGKVTEAQVREIAERIAQVVLAHKAARLVTVTVHKPSAPITVPFDDVAVTITRARA